MECIDLKRKFGKEYRIAYEQSYYAERGDSARADDPWLQILLCRHGHVFPFGGQMLAASTNKRGAVGRALAELSCTTVVQDGDDGITAVFHLDDFDTVAELLKPRRRRQVSEQERARLAAMGRASLEKHRHVNAQASKTRLETHEACLAESEVA